MRLRKIFREAPLFGGLVDCSIRDHWRALAEIAIILILSTVPIWLGTFVVFVLGGVASWEAFGRALTGTIQTGELFIYTTSLLAPVFWSALSDPPGAEAFPSKISHMLFIVIVSMIAAAAFGILKSGAQFNLDILFISSLLVFSISVVLLYLGAVYHNARLPNPSAAFRESEDRFVQEFNRQNTS